MCSISGPLFLILFLSAWVAIDDTGLHTIHQLKLGGLLNLVSKPQWSEVAKGCKGQLSPLDFVPFTVCLFAVYFGAFRCSDSPPFASFCSMGGDGGGRKSFTLHVQWPQWCWFSNCQAGLSSFAVPQSLSPRRPKYCNYCIWHAV